MATTFTAAQLAAVQSAADYLTFAPAPENQFHIDAIQRLAKTATDIGFSRSTGQFVVACGNKPFSTLIRFVAFVGNAVTPASPTA